MRLIIAAFLTLVTTSVVHSTTITSRDDWKAHFQQNEVEGTIAILDERKSRAVFEAYNTERAKQRFSPASTFKIPHALFALDRGLIQNGNEIIKWDGKKRNYAPWNRDQTLKSAITNSTVWVFEKFAAQIGSKAEQAYITSCNYGNMSVVGDNPFWIKGELNISAYEQLIFLRLLYNNKLPFKIEHQSLVKNLIKQKETGLNLYAKSGWNGSVGWWVGWSITPEGTIFFALNIDTPNGMKDLPARSEVTKSILHSIMNP